MRSSLTRAEFKRLGVMTITSDAVVIDATGATRTFYKAGVNVFKATKILLARLMFKGESFVKAPSVTPYRTGTLRRSIHAAPTTYPTQIAAGVNYAFYANVRSKHPRYIERTHGYIIRIFPHESDLVLKNALKGMQK